MIMININFDKPERSVLMPEGKMSPVLKWAGGKKQLIEKIKKKYTHFI